jgi:hypothetical protein
MTSQTAISQKPNIGGRLETTTAYIKDLIRDIQKGEIKIPQFQRKFVWKEDQALKLLDSISNNYPAGSILLWRTQIKLAVERNIGDFKLPKTDDHSPTDYVLDGQQRITVIYSCLGAPAEDGGFAAGYDLDRQEFVQLPASRTSPIFPMRWLFDTTKLLDFRTGLQTSSQATSYQSRLDDLIGAFQNYRLPVVILKELTVDEVCPIFERINSSGTKLSMYDLIVAATWTPRFDLNTVSESVATSLEGKGFEEIDSTTILKCLAAVHAGGMKKSQLLDLRNVGEGEMQQLVERTKAALLRAVDLLSTEFRIHSWDFLPYEAVLVITCYICSRLQKLEQAHVIRLRQWFWRSAFNERYRVGGENFVSRDLELVRDFVQNGDDPSAFGPPPSDEVIRNSSFRSNNSRSRAFILALASCKPRNLTNGALIDTANALSQFNKKQFHHIHPKAHLRRISETDDQNVLANICMLVASENNSVSDSPPQEYLPAFIDSHGSTADGVLRSNLMPDTGNFDYATSSFSEFINSRSILVANYVSSLCMGESN